MMPCRDFSSNGPANVLCGFFILFHAVCFLCLAHFFYANMLIAFDCTRDESHISHFIHLR